MKKLVWSATFVRAYRGVVRRHPELRGRIEPESGEEEIFLLTIGSHEEVY